MIICVTGHRPDKLYGYDLTDPRWQDLKNIFKEKLIEMKCTNAISGMALGVDTIFALAVLELKKEGHPIQLHCALPCPEQCKKWNHVDIVRYREILMEAKTVKVVADHYEADVMQKRNEYMVDHSDIVLAVWKVKKVEQKIVSNMPRKWAKKWNISSHEPCPKNFVQKNNCEIFSDILLV